MIPGLIDITPGPNLLDIGPLHIGWYGVGYVLGLAVLVLVTQREVERRGIKGSHVNGALIMTVVLAVIGGRLYHVIDDWDRYSQDLAAIVLPPYAGLGLYGGVLGAVIGIALYTRRHHIPIWRALDAVTPGALFAQGIARWGNFFNQELYGGPTDAPWGIAIDCDHRVTEYPCTTFPADSTGFHPLFLYESALDIFGGFLALWIGRRFPSRLREGDVASFWTIWYGSVRFVLETFRQGYNWTVAGGFATAQLIGIALIIFGLVTITVRHQRSRPADPEPAEQDPIIEPSPDITQ